MTIAQEEHSPLLPAPSKTLTIPSCSVGWHNQTSQSNRGVDTATIRLSLVIPTYNESRNIAAIIQILDDLLKQAIPHQYELIVVDDDSPDRTWEIAQALTESYPQLKVMRRQSERGLATAVIRGWQASNGGVLGVIDGDLQHPPEILLKLLAAIDRGADLAVASRHVEGGGVSRWSVIRRTLSRGAQLIGLIVLPRVVGRVTDPMSGYFLVRRSAIAEKSLSPLGYKILIEVVGRGEISKITEIGYVFRERQAGESKVSWKQYVEYLRHLLRLRISTGRLKRVSRYFDFPVGRFIRFGLVGLSGLLVDMGFLYLLHGMLGLGLTRSAILAAECAILNNFLWNDLWTFGDIAYGQRQWRKMLKRLVKFNIICLMGLILKVLLLNILFNGLSLNPYLANFLAIMVVVIWNFWVNLKLNWRTTQT